MAVLGGTPETYFDDTGKQQKDVKVSEMVAVGEDTLVILERVSETTKLYLILVVVTAPP